MTSSRVLRLAVSAGDPSGVGPDVVVAAASENWNSELVFIGDGTMLAERADLLGLPLSLETYDPATPRSSGNGTLSLIHTPLVEIAKPGAAQVANAPVVVDVLRACAKGCMEDAFDAMVTAPVNKAVINDSGTPFSGHTEFLAELTGAEKVVMLLASGNLRVALATTHIPLRQVPDAINQDDLVSVLDVINADLKAKFGLSEPRIAVLGLNPHAGEGGHLGVEDMEVVAPAVETAQRSGVNAVGPVPADTAFNVNLREATDAYLAMYHDQGLPVLKYASFGAAVNITLGLPIIRTSVDHGTAFDIAATGKASAASFVEAVRVAERLAGQRL
ncbi:MAG: 4-hydroxythreonine-4-phosphate dehydrogenase PdxA [Pseudomonadota bacterium]